MSRIIHRIFVLTISVAPFLCLVIISGDVILRFLSIAETHLGGILASEATQYLGHEVRIGKITTLNGDVVIEHIQIAEGKTIRQSGTMVQARRVTFDFAWRRFFLEKSLVIPRIWTIHVYDPDVKIQRLQPGKWNFLSLFKKKSNRKSRPSFSQIDIQNGRLTYVDATLPHNRQRKSQTDIVRVKSINGAFYFPTDGGVYWDVSGAVVSGQAGKIHVSGSYLSPIKRLGLNIQADHVSLPIMANRFLPLGYDIQNGVAAGDVSIVRTPNMKGWIPFDIQGDIAIRNGDVYVSRMHRSITGISGETQVANNWLHIRNASANFAGMPVNLQGDLMDFTNPEFHGSISSSAVNYASLAKDFNIGGAFKSLQTARAKGSFKLSLNGPLHSLLIGAEGYTSLQGRIPLGKDQYADLGLSALHFVAVGTPQNPDIMVSAKVPYLTWQGHRATNARFSAHLFKHHLDVTLKGTCFGGSCVLNGIAFTKPKGFDYRVNASCRNIDLASLPISRVQLQGSGNADFALIGNSLSKYPRLRANVQANNLHVNQYNLHNFEGEFRSYRHIFYVDELDVGGNDGKIDASGSVDLKTHILDLSASANHINIKSLIQEYENGGKIEASDGNSPLNSLKIANLGGEAFLNGVRIQGTWDDPQINGTVNIYSLAYNNVQMDLFTTDFEASKEELKIINGTAWRFPAIASITGVITNPLSSKATLNLNGDFQRLELQDIAEMAGKNWQMSGASEGSFQVTGTYSQPDVSMPVIIVKDATLADFTFDNLSLSLNYQSTSNGASLTVPAFHAGIGSSTIDAQASMDSANHFIIISKLNQLDLSLFQPWMKDYIVMSGKANGTLKLEGNIVSGAVKGMQGEIDASTTGLTINDEQPGDLVAKILFDDNRITSNAIALRGLNSNKTLMQVDNFEYNVDKSSFKGDLVANSIPFELIRHLIVNSPYAVSQPNSPLVYWLNRLSNPLQGDISMQAHLTDTDHHPDIAFQWNGNQIIVENQPISVFKGSGIYTPGSLALNDAELQAGESSISAQGKMVFAKSIDGDISMNNLPLQLLGRWFPNTPVLSGLSGTADLIYIQASGNPSQPKLTLSSELSHLLWKDPQIATGKEFQVDHISISKATLQEGSINADDIRIILKGQKSNPKQPAPEYLASAKGSIQFSWISPFIPPDPKLDMSVRIKNQSLSILTAFLPNSNAVLEGNLDASFDWTGTLKKPDIHGQLQITQSPSDKIQLSGMSTALTDLNSLFSFDGSSLRVDHFSADTKVFDLGTGKTLLASQPITMSGDLPLHEGVANSKGLTISIPRLVVAETPLPILHSGSLVTGDTAANFTITGTLFKPNITGNIHVNQAEFKMPQIVATSTTPSEMPFSPMFHLGITLGKAVTISSAQLSAVVYTEPAYPMMLTGTLEHPNFSGHVTIDRGTLVFPTARFVIQRGGVVDLRFPTYAMGDYANPSLGININLVANTHLMATSVNGSYKRYTITVEASGPINMGAPLTIATSNQLVSNTHPGSGLILRFRSDPADLAPGPQGLQERITGLLGGQNSIEQLFSRNPDVGRILGQQLSDILSNSYLPSLLEKMGLRKALGLEDISVEYNNMDAFSFHVSRKLFGPFYISYWRLFTGTNSTSYSGNISWELKTSYRIRDNLQFSWSVDDQKTNAYLLEGVFKF